MWIVKTKQILNLTIRILKFFFNRCCLLVGFYSPCFYWSAFTFSITNTDISKSANISHTVHIMKADGQYPMRVHDVVPENVNNKLFQSIKMIWWVNLPSTVLIMNSIS